MPARRNATSTRSPVRITTRIAGLLIACLAVCAQGALAEDVTAPASDDAAPASYSISLDGGGAYWSIRLNGVTIWQDFQARDATLTLPVNAYLREGRNEVDVTFVSVAGSPFAYNVASPDFHFAATLVRVDSATRERDRVTLLNLALDSDNAVRFPDKTHAGLPPDTRTTAPMKVGEDRQDAHELASGWDADAQRARRVTAHFQVDDPLPAPPWADAPVIADTPDTRAALLAAYRDLHATLQTGDHARVQAAYGTTWQHIARSTYGWSMETFIARTRPFAALAPDGLTLQPLDLVLGPDRFRIERMAGGRLLRIVPDPLIWRAHPGAEDVTTTKVAFFQGLDGRLQVGAVLF